MKEPERSVTTPRRVLTERLTTTDVFIVNWNTADLLISCLASLSATEEYDDLHVVVVDNGSSDGSAELVRDTFPDVSIIANDTNVGFAQAHNQAYESSESPYVLLLNSDVEVPSGTISHCRRYLETHPETGVVGCAIRHPDGSPQNSIFRFPSLRGILTTSLMVAQIFPNSRWLNVDRYGSSTPKAAMDVDVVMGSFFMVRRGDVIGQLLDDGYFMYAEEADLCRRMADQGLATTFEPAVAITHIKSASIRSAAQKAWSYGAKRRAILRYLRKWRGPVVAQAANGIMLADLLPRSVGWLGADLLSLVRGRTATHFPKIKIAGFHLRAMANPSLMDERFTGPPEAEVARSESAMDHIQG